MFFPPEIHEIINIMKPVYLISALCENNGIGSKGGLPWKLKKEMEYFTQMTSKTLNDTCQNAVIMGRKTWESIPNKYKPLAKRINVVISKSSDNFPKNVFHFESVIEAVNALQSQKSDFANVETIWIIGGYAVYKEALDKKLCEKLFLTRIKEHYECDVFFPDFSETDYRDSEHANVPKELQEENGVQYYFKVYERKLV